ncbi:MAG TPA: cytochrome b/b6 domain-containing protein [Candidatus Cybelea sp.]|nr:cytochrome b/b6 domain-containing protein [Candidatus Cybelea sp.]
MANEVASRSAPVRSVPVWDPYVRLFHWLLVIGMAAAWWTGKSGPMDLHYKLGLIVLFLVIFRLLWGLVGSPTARFAHFLKGPSAVFSYMRTMALPKPSFSFGHNAGGGVMVAVLLIVVLIQDASGLFNTDDVLFEGPFYNAVPESFSRLMGFIHAQFFNLVLVLVALHVAVIALYLVWKRENLVRAMVTGRARLPEPVARAAEANGETRFASPFRALACAAVAAAVPIAIYYLG